MKKLLLFLSIMLIGQIHGQIITTVVGNGTAAFSGDGGQAAIAELNYPCGIVFDAGGNKYIADQTNNRIRKVNTSGVINTIGGNGTAGFSGDGGQATIAEFTPFGVAVDVSGNIYIADRYNNRIRMINTAGNISTVAGNGTYGFSGDGGQATAAALKYPNGVAIDASNNLYIFDGNNRIRMVNSSGVINTIAGNGLSGFSGDGGPATSAGIWDPYGITFDATGNMYIADTWNNCIRKINTSGIITTVAGNGTMGFSGDGGQATSAQLQLPYGILVDAVGNIFIADSYNHRIRKVDASGIITTIAGNGTQGSSGDGGLATAAELYSPQSLAFDASGNLYIAEADNNRIRKITHVAGIEQMTPNNIHIALYPNPTSDQFFIETNTTDKLNVDLFDVNGRHVFSTSVMDKSNINVATLDNGIYKLTIKSVDRVTNKKLVIVH